MFETYTRPVYAYYSPDVRKIVDEVVKEYPHDVFLRSITPGLDAFHEPVIEKYLNVYAEYMPGLDTFPYRYVSGGSSEAIFHTLSALAAQEKRPPLYIVEGEYEGYAGYGSNLELHFITVPDGMDPASLAPGIFYLSNPSSRNGNSHHHSLIEKIGNAGHEIYLDCAYVGMTAERNFLVNHPAITAVFTSMSKPYGMYYYRLGFSFMRKPLLTLEVNKWFKNVFSLIVADRILSILTPQSMYEKYHLVQKTILEEANTTWGSNLKASQVYLLAHVDSRDIPPNKQDIYRAFHRGGEYYRFGLTAEFLRRE